LRGDIDRWNVDTTLKVRSGRQWNRSRNGRRLRRRVGGRYFGGSRLRKKVEWGNAFKEREQNNAQSEKRYPQHVANRNYRMIACKAQNRPFGICAITLNRLCVYQAFQRCGGEKVEAGTKTFHFWLYYHTIVTYFVGV